MDKESHLHRIIAVVWVDGKPDRRCAGPNVKGLYFLTHKQTAFVRKRLRVAKDGQLAKQERYVGISCNPYLSYYLILGYFEAVGCQVFINPFKSPERSPRYTNHADTAVG